jgi:ribosome-binding protein aMBF1 (putative translation factor)
MATTRKETGPCRDCGGPVQHCELCGQVATIEVRVDGDSASICDDCDAALDDEARALAGGR